MLAFCVLIVGLIFLIGSLDDLMIDLAHFLGRSGPVRTSSEDWQKWRQFEEKAIAVMIPAWKEANVLESMVRTNLTRLKYKNYKWYIGVYPNDKETLNIANELEKRYPEKVKIVQTDRPGPTSKAHCLNCILRVIDEQAEKDGWKPHYVVIHDAEDVIHPDSFTLVNTQSENIDFIQLPIFSLPVSAKLWVAGTYLDEFAEIHLKEVPIRQQLKMPIPSAGVGTFFSWKILKSIESRFGYCFDENNLTEDYEISQRIARLDGEQRFLLVRDENKNVIATREFFPDTLGRSIRQKTRWTTGICLQTSSKWGRYGKHVSLGYKLKDFANSYALYRDRKALWSNPAVFVAWILVILLLIQLGLNPERGSFLQDDLSPVQYKILMTVIQINTFLFLFRLLQRARFTSNIYGNVHGILAIPRMFASNIINGMSSLRAIKEFVLASKTKKGNEVQIAWAKTDHKFPEMEEIEAAHFSGSKLEIKNNLVQK